METKERKKQTFVDKEGRVWFLELTTPAIIDGCTACQINLDDLMEMRVNVASLIRLIWFTARTSGHIFGIKKESVFFAEILTPDILPDAFQAFMESLVASFPEASDLLGELPTPPGVKKPTKPQEPAPEVGI